jgi:hypothetical protein
VSIVGDRPDRVRGLGLRGLRGFRRVVDPLDRLAVRRLLAGLHTGFRPCGERTRTVARVYRAAGDERRSADHEAEADLGFAQVLERIHDRAIRDALVSAATSGPSSGGVER